MNAMRPHAIAVSGASGYVGRTLLSYLDGHDYDTVPLTRNPAALGPRARKLVLGAPLEPGLLDDVDCLVHAAWDLTLTGCSRGLPSERRGVASLDPRSKIRRCPSRCLISSMSAYEGTRQFYGRAKLEVESLVSSLGGVSLRLGLIYGPDAGGMASALAGLAKLPIFPVPGGNQSSQFLLSAADLGPAIERALTARVGGVVGVADPAKLSVPEVIRMVCGDPERGRFVSVPWRPIYYSMKLAERLGVKLPLRSDSLLGLVRPAPKGVPNVAALGLTFNCRPVAPPTPKSD